VEVRAAAISGALVEGAAQEPARRPRIASATRPVAAIAKARSPATTLSISEALERW
jgi:hypothetical protein